MKQKTRIASKLFAALVVLTLISCCFLGTTMARYTTSDSGVAKVEVATWAVTITPEGTIQSGETVLDFGKLSPNKNATGSTDTNLSHNTGRKLVAILSVANATDVEVNVTIDLGSITFLNDSHAEITQFGEGAPFMTDCAAVFSIAFYDTETNDSTIALTSDKNYTHTVPANTDWSLKLYADVTWTTYYEGSENITDGWDGATGADRLDTWIGTNIAYVSWDLSYTAVQASELPA